MARNLAGADYITGSIGSIAGINSSGHTLLTICRRGANSAWHTPLSIETSGNQSKLALQFSDTNRIQLIIGTSNKDTTVSIGTADNWVLAAATRAGGSSVPRGHKYVYDTNTWTHTDAAAATGGDSTDLTGGRIQIGRWQTTDFYNGDILLVAAWKRALTDAELENLPFSLQALLAAAPDALWVLDQAATSHNVIDLTGGGANQTGVTNTSVASGSVPIWNYGAGASVGIGQAGGGGIDATASPAATTVTVALPAATISAASAEAPAAVAAVVAMPAPSASAGATATPAATAATTALPAASVSAAAAKTPAAVAAVASLPQAAISASATARPAAITCTVTLPSPTVNTSGNTTVSPNAIATTIQLPAAGPSAGSRVAPTATAALISLPAVVFQSAAVKATSTDTVLAYNSSAGTVLARSASVDAVTAAARSSGGVT